MQLFKTKLKKFSSSELWHYHITIPETIAHVFIEGKNSRVLCSLNGLEPFQCAIMKGGGSFYFINLNKEIRKKTQIVEGTELLVKLEKDGSEYGLPFPEEFMEVLLQDPESKEWFDALTAGKKRNLLYIVNKVKSTEIRIRKSIIIADHLKLYKGKIDFKALNLAFKDRQDI